MWNHEHRFEDEHGQRRPVGLFVKRPRFFGHPPIAGVFWIFQAVAFGKAAGETHVRIKMWEKAIKHQRTALLTGMCRRPVALVRRVDSMRHPKHSSMVSDDDGDRSLNCGP